MSGQTPASSPLRFGCWHERFPADNPKAMPPDLTAIFKLELPIVVEIGQRTLPLREVISLCPGTMIELDKPAEDDLGIFVNDRPIGVGQVVKVGENFGIRVNRIGDAGACIRALDASQPTGGPSDDGP